METVLPAVTEDDEAMRRVAGGDQQALAWLFDRHKARLYGFLCYLVGDRPLAEDLLGETFLRVYRARGGYRYGSGFTAWLYRIARNLALGELRKRSVRDRLQTRLAWEVRSTEQEVWPQDDCSAEIRAALLALPEEQRAAIVLKEYRELSYREIALVLGCTEEAARARTYRARQSLRTALQDWWANKAMEQ
jgi:RNA polymerase sigma-70 factor (ECF subfamily)